MYYPILKNRKVWLSAILILTISISVNAQVGCLTTGWKNASNFSTNDSIGDFDFVSVTNAQLSEDLHTSATTDVSKFSGVTYFIEATDFGFAVPLSATLCGIMVEIELRGGGTIISGVIKDNQIKIIEKGSITGEDRASSNAWTTTDTYVLYGDEGDTWGLTLLPEVVNMSNFGVAVSVGLYGSPSEILSAEIDHIRMKVDYKMILPVNLSYFKANKNGYKAELEWKTEQEESNGAIYLQRSVNNQNWEQIAAYALSSQTGKLYRYQDIMQEKGNYSYRLQMVSATGNKSYSSILKLVNEGKTGMSVYPSPATDFVILENFPDPKMIKMYNVVNQEEKVNPEKIGQGVYRINITTLRQGSYIIKSGNQVFRFIKI